MNSPAIQSLQITTMKHATAFPGPPKLFFPSWGKPPSIAPSRIERFEAEQTTANLWAHWWECNLEAFGLLVEKFHSTPGVPVFWNSTLNAKHNVAFLDKHLELGNVERILQILKIRDAIQDTDKINVAFIGLFNEKTDEIKSAVCKWQNGVKKTSVHLFRLPEEIDTKGIPPKQKKIFHDRFALVDNAIWHFGAAVGAMHKSINAFSGPWVDKDNSMRCLLIEIMQEGVCIYPTKTIRARDALPPFEDE